MLKGKKSLYVFIPLNAIVWGLVAYRIYSYFKDDSSLSDVGEFNIIVPKQLVSDSLGYILDLNYEDPFLKEEPKVQKKQSIGNDVHKKVTIPKPTVPEKTYDVKYLGLISNTSSGATTALISIDGKSYIGKAGNSIEGVKLESINSSFMIIKIGKQRLTINKQ